MQKLGVYLILLVIGALIGVSGSAFLSKNQTSSFGEKVKVTIQGIAYSSEDSVLEFELRNNVPEKNLEGFLNILQEGRQWSGKVTWYYTGDGRAEVVCDFINETESFRVTYREVGQSDLYLDRIVGWNEVNQTFV